MEYTRFVAETGIYFDSPLLSWLTFKGSTFPILVLEVKGEDRRVLRVTVKLKWIMSTTWPRTSWFLESSYLSVSVPSVVLPVSGDRILVSFSEGLWGQTITSTHHLLSDSPLGPFPSTTTPPKRQGYFPDPFGGTFTSWEDRLQKTNRDKRCVVFIWTHLLSLTTFHYP